MRVLVTGAAGFIGSHVTKALVQSGHDVIALLEPGTQRHRLSDMAARITLVEANLEDTAAVRRTVIEYQPAACIHLAWYVEPGKYLDSAKNINAVVSTLNLFRELFAHDCRHVIGAGTCAEYQTQDRPLREDDPVGPATLYAASKLSVNLIGQQMAALAGARFAWARLFYLYGPGEDERRLVPAVIRSLLKEQPFPATAGEQVRDYLHVSDVAAAFATVLEQRAAGIFNICSGVPVTVRHLLETAATALGRPELIRIGELSYRDWEPAVMCGDNGRLRQIGWSPRFDLDDGLRDAADWWKTIDIDAT